MVGHDGTPLRYPPLRSAGCRRAKEAAVIAKELDQEAEEIALKSKKPTTLKEKNDNGREVIYIRYYDINMKYVYLCVNCDTTWKTDNRV